MCPWKCFLHGLVTPLFIEKIYKHVNITREDCMFWSRRKGIYVWALYCIIVRRRTVFTSSCQQSVEQRRLIGTARLPMIQTMIDAHSQVVCSLALYLSTTSRPTVARLSSLRQTLKLLVRMVYICMWKRSVQTTALNCDLSLSTEWHYASFERNVVVDYK